MYTHICIIIISIELLLMMSPRRGDPEGGRGGPEDEGGHRRGDAGPGF